MNDNSGCGKAAVIIGAIAALVTTIIFITGKTSLPELFGARQSEQEHLVTVQPQQPVLVVNPTIAPEPTLRPPDTPRPTPRPTEPPAPPPTPAPDTQPGTILEVGQTWRQGGSELRLVDARPASILGGQILGIEVRYKLTSGKAQDVTLRYSLGDCVSASTNQGRRLEIGRQDHSSSYLDGTHPYETSFETMTTMLHSGDTIDLFAVGGYFDNPWVMIKADTADPSLTEIIVAFTGLSSIDNARWRIPIYH